MKFKHGVFFSIDALIAVILILGSILVIYPLISSPSRNSFVQGDLIVSLSSLKIGDVNNSYVRGLISDGKITDLNKSVLEQVAEFYIFNKSLAQGIADSIFDDLDVNSNFGIWFGDELIASRNTTAIESAKDVKVSSQIISGLRDGESVTAYSGRAFLSSSLQSDYFYFGGYIGEGNISARIEYFGTISSAEIELVAGNDFDVYVNGHFAGRFENGSSPYIPVKYDLPTGDFSSGVNYVEFVGDRLSIAGGFVKINYQRDVSYSVPEKHYFPGIKGILNIYDGFYFPGNLSSLNIFLNLNSSLNVFMNLGNSTVFLGNTSGVFSNISLNNSYLSSVLDYDSLEGKTVPLRIGLENASYLTSYYVQADVFSVTDLSGSMTPYCSVSNVWCCLFTGGCSTEPQCLSCGGSWIGDKIVEAKLANKAFIDILLNHTGNKAGLVGYANTAPIADFHNLSTNNVSLKAKVDAWNAYGSTCICCGINSAVNALRAGSNSSKYRSLIVMSDGAANVRCAQQATGNAKNDAIAAACDAYQDYGIIVYSIGFGTDVDEATLQSIATCGNGSYYYSSVDELEDIYESITNEIVEATFFEQKLVVSGNIYNALGADSYLEFDSGGNENPYGLITTVEKNFTNSTHGYFGIPENSTVLDAKVVSYSGSKWTDLVRINGTKVYDLSDYGDEYIYLGDPYFVNLPVSLISDSNEVSMTTALSPTNRSEASIYNKIIYTLANNFSAYSSMEGVSEGCDWFVEFDDGTNASFSVPEDYFGGENCRYTSLEQEVSNNDDATQVSVFNLLRSIDYDTDGQIDVSFSSQDLKISSSELTGIPYDWSTKMQVRVWR